MASSNDGSTKSTKCSTCKKEQNSELHACKNGHGLCDDCWDDGEICKLCIKKVTDALNIPLIDVLDRVAILCNYNANGCKELLRADRINDHEKLCYYRNEHCFSCKEILPLHKINDHFKNRHFIYSEHTDCNESRYVIKEKSFSEKFIIIWSKQKLNTTSYRVFRYNINSIQTHFVVKLMDFDVLEKPTICVQYLGEVQENAGKYRFDIKINQGLPDSYVSYTGLCMPYTFSDEETKKQKGLIELNFKTIFLTDNAYSDKKFEMEMTISEVNLPKNDDPKQPEGGCIIQ